MAVLRVNPPLRTVPRRIPGRRIWSHARNIPLAPVTFPTTPLRILVEIFINGAWVDVTAYVRYATGIQITRGRPDGSSTSAPSQCRLTVDNRSGNWVRRNPYSIWYPYLTIGTPLRVSVDPGSGMVHRFTGGIYEYPPRWGAGEVDRFVPLVAQGALRQLRQGTPVAKDPVSTASTTSAPKASWPLTDAAGSTTAASATGGTAATPNGNVGSHFGAVTGPDGTAKYPSFVTGGTIDGTVTYTSTSNDWSAKCIAQVDSAVSANLFILAWETGNASSPQWAIQYTSAGNINVNTFDGTTVVTVATVVRDLVDSAWHEVQVSAAQAGTDIAVTLYIDGLAATAGTIAAQTNAKVTGPFSAGDTSSSTQVTSVGQVAFYDTATPTSTVAALTSYTGEEAMVRYVRLLAAAGYPVVPAAWASEPMGVQPTATLPELLDECATTEIGVITDTVDGEFDLHTRGRRENALVALTVNDDAGQLAPPFEPADDDRLLRNKWTVTRSGGSSAVALDQASIDATGQVEDSATVNTATDAALASLAGWRLHLTTADDLRHAMVVVNLARNPDLIPQALAVDISSRVTLTNPPPGLPPDPIDVLVEQVNEYVDQTRWMMGFATSPATPWRVGVWADTLGDGGPFGGHYEWTTCVLAEDLDTTETEVDITASPLTTTNAADFPFDIMVGGEQMTVTSCAGAVNPQTLTVVRSVNTVVKTAIAGTAVVLHPSSAFVWGS